jgi:hypothetical protein
LGDDGSSGNPYLLFLTIMRINWERVSMPHIESVMQYNEPLMYFPLSLDMVEGLWRLVWGGVKEEGRGTSGKSLREPERVVEQEKL